MPPSSLTWEFQYPHWCGRRDKRGFPIFMLDVAYLDRAALTDHEKTRSADPNASQLACVVHDSLTRFVLPLCSAMRDRPNPTAPITGGVYIIDISEFRLKQSWSLKTYAQETSQLLSINYPEVIDRVFVRWPRVWSYEVWVDKLTIW